MSEYQYFEFLAIDRPLNADDRAALRRISTRGEITSTRFTNEYHWGNLKADPLDFMKQWFDVHVYFANWGTRRLMLGLPRDAVDFDRLRRFEVASESLQIHATPERAIVDIHCSPEDGGDPFLFKEEEGWMDRLAPLRAKLMAGDLRVLYLPWLYDAWSGYVEDDEPEPMPGIGPLTTHLADAGRFLGLPDDVMKIAAERSDTSALAPDDAGVRTFISRLSESDKVDFLMRVAQGDPGVAAELQRLARHSRESGENATKLVLRTADEILQLLEQRSE